MKQFCQKRHLPLLYAHFGHPFPDETGHEPVQCAYAIAERCSSRMHGPSIVAKATDSYIRVAFKSSLFPAEPTGILKRLVFYPEICI
jgi:hypothetical protein